MRPWRCCRRKDWTTYSPATPGTPRQRGRRCVPGTWISCARIRANTLTSLTAVVMPDGHDADALRKTILDRYNMSLGTGLAQLKGSVFRIGHLGDFNDLDADGHLVGRRDGPARCRRAAPSGRGRSGDGRFGQSRRQGRRGQGSLTRRGHFGAAAVTLASRRVGTRGHTSSGDKVTIRSAHRL